MNAIDALLIAVMIDDGVVQVGDTCTRYHRTDEEGLEENFVVSNDDGGEIFSGTEQECIDLMEKQV